MPLTRAQRRKSRQILLSLPPLDGERCVRLLNEMHAIERKLRELGDERQRCDVAAEDRRIGARMVPLLARLAAVRDELGMQVGT